MLNLVNLLFELVQEHVLIGVIKDSVSGTYLRIEYKTPDGVTFKAAEIRETTPGYSVSFYRMIDGVMGSEGHSHITKTGHLCETMWREFGQDVGKLIRFFDANPQLKEEVI